MGTAIYCRISSDPNEKEAGVRRQEADCRELAERDGLSDLTVYVDNDVSASQPMENRPAFMRMLTDAQDGLVTTIIAWRDDRLWRNVDHKNQVFAIARESGVKSIITMDQSYDPASIGDQFVSTLKAAFAEYEAAGTKLRVNRAMRERAEQGLPHGGLRPFGYEKDRVTVKEDEAELIREAATRVLSGEPIARICDDWNRRGVAGTNGGMWQSRTLAGILSNPRYIGKRAHRGVVVSDAVWPAILDAGTFKRLERVFSSRRRGPNADRHLLSGFVYCAGCDDRLAAGYTRGKRLYRTHRQGKRERSCGLSLSIPAEPLEALMQDAVIERLSKGTIPASAHADNERSQALLAELESVRERIDELNEMWKAGELTRAERASLRGDLVQRQNELETTLAKLAAPGLPNDVPNGPEALERAWRERGVEWQRKVVNALVARIEVVPANYAEGERVCKWCEKEDISDRHQLAKYCSSKCNNAAYEDRKRHNKNAGRPHYQGVDQRVDVTWIA